MAADAGGCQFLVYFANMAGDAGDSLMATTQRELGFFMIKGGNFLPGINDMTALAIVAKIAPMWLILLVTADTGLGCLTIFFACDMAPNAICSLVPSNQRVVGVSVVKD